ncbi:MAG: GNAT family N-acetyltransferase [Eubacteriales bacterium]
MNEDLLLLKYWAFCEEHKPIKLYYNYQMFENSVRKREQMNVELCLAESSEIIKNLFQYYIYDMSEYTKFSPNPDGTYKVDESNIQINTYWSDSDHYPYLIMVDNEIAGFTLLRKFPFNKEYYDVGQFFVLRKFKNLGVGREAFRLSVTTHPGKWITRVLPNNDGAYRFWAKVISEISVNLPEVKKELYMGKEMNCFYYNVNGEMIQK